MPVSVLSLLLLGVVAVATLAVVVALAWSLGMLRQPRALVQHGHWREAAIAAERLGRSWLRVFPSVRAESAHARAACLHLEGKLEESLAASRSLREGALLEGANLVMLGRDPGRAVERLTAACASPRSSPEDHLFLVLAKHAAGDATGAATTFASIASTRPPNAPSPRIYEPAFRYLRGLYLLKVGRPDEAAADLGEAAKSAITTIYVARAQALVSPPPSPDDGDPRSSLTGQVIETDRS